MKHFITLLLTLIALNGMGQESTAVNAGDLLKKTDSLINRCRKMIKEMDEYTSANLLDITGKPDTLRATLVVSYDGGTMSVLHTKPGFVVRQSGKPNVYLDDRKRVMKNCEVWNYKLK